MPFRRIIATPPALPLSVLAIFALCSPARAHRLEAEYRVLPGRQVAIESWFDLTGDSPVGGAVTVYRQAGGAVLAEGKLDRKGLFVFTYSQKERLRVVVSAAGGHRKELEIPAAELTEGDPVLAKIGTDAEPSIPLKTENGAREPFADRASRVSVKDVLLGVAFLLALAAFGLALSNARKLRALRRSEREKPDEQVISSER